MTLVPACDDVTIPEEIQAGPADMISATARGLSYVILRLVLVGGGGSQVPIAQWVD